MGLQPLRWNAFAQAAGASFAALAASFTPNKLQVLNQAGTGLYPAMTYRFSVTSGHLPAWVQPGAGVNIAASVTISGTSLTVSDDYIVKAVDPSGLYFDVNAPRPHGGRDAVAITQTVAATNLDSGSGNVTAPLVSLVIQCQKAMLSASAGSVIIAPVVDAAGAAPYTVTLTPTSGEYEITGPNGSKFDLADWQVKQSGSGTLSVRFL